MAKVTMKDVPKMFSDDAVEFPNEMKVIKVESNYGMKMENYKKGGLSKNVIYNVGGNKKKDQ